MASASATSNRARTPAGVLTKIPSVSGPANRQRFEGLAGVKPDTKRVLFFSEQPVDPNDPNSDTEFFITVDGQTPTVFSPDNPPAIVTTQGTTEDWIIQNRSLEQHDFHIHQIHFLLLERDGHPVPPSARQFRDMIPIPFWKGKGPYPSVKVRMDFRGPDVGDFVYHCHILEHEDKGMMAIIRVQAASAKAQPSEPTLAQGRFGAAKPVVASSRDR
jgi:FtsP/CotA-like multicopper oxidase with cupredoxin domain